ncbi:MAG: glutamine--fructose-6-phosphate transaminase (isomerizing) [Kiritimatiellia bacterium]
MCGIIGYVGKQDAPPIILDGLRRLEYRGYDSAGMAVLSGGKLKIQKCVGRLSNLEQFCKENPMTGTPGVGHTRWATHGEPSEVNSHPHTDASGEIAVVHNGIIENYLELREMLEREGFKFKSQTDTEVIPNLIAFELRKDKKDFSGALSRALQRARGAYALGILWIHEPDRIYAARHGSPLIIGLGDGENFIASDVPAIINRVKRVIYLNDGEMACLTADKIKLSNLKGEEVAADIHKVTIHAEAASKAGFETFMLKEIHEQPRVMQGLLAKHAEDRNKVIMDLSGLGEDYCRGIDRVMIVSCGTAYYAGCYGRLFLELLLDVNVEVELGSELRYRPSKLDPKTLVIAVSQSGETADTIAAVKKAKAAGCKIFSICNVAGSSLVRESHAVFFTEAGPEIGVASTKAFTAQLMAFALFSLRLARLRGELPDDRLAHYLDELYRVPAHIHHVLGREDTIREVADKHHGGPSALYLGRRFNYPIALEGALKNKEISYQHAEGYAAGEMKHGPIALINEYLPVVCICTKTADELYEKMISNVREVDARHGRVIAIATDGDEAIRGLAEDIIYVPEICEEFSPMVNVVALQLLAYYSAQARGTDIDKPRNLAKSVTVE